MTAPTTAPEAPPANAPTDRPSISPDVFGRPVADDRNANPESVAHLVDQRIPNNNVDHAYLHGTELIALCGHRWVPNRNPHVLPICRCCAEIALDAMGGDS